MIPSSTEKTICAYDKNAGNYLKKFDNHETYRKKIRTFQSRYIPENAHILDLGCGPGNNVKAIVGQDATCTFTGIDLSAEMIRVARQRFPQFLFLHQDIRELRLDATYDIILASFCIVHLLDHETTDLIRTISRHLDREGHLYLSYMNGTTSGFETTSFSREEIFFNYYTDDFIFQHLEHNDITIVEIEKEEYPEQDGSCTTDTFIYARKES